MARKTGQGPPEIELEIANFGPIAGGRVVLRPLTVFVGPNGSGKSYASVLAHSVVSSCADTVRAARSGDWAGALLDSGEFYRLSGRVARLAASANGGRVEVPRGLASKIRECTVGRLFEKSLVRHMGYNFGSHLGALVRTGSRASRIRIRGPVRADVSITRTGGAAVRAGFGDARRPVRGSADVAGMATGARRGAAAKGGRNGASPPAGSLASGRDPGALLELAAGIAGQAVTGRECGASRYLPAARSGVMCAYGTLAPGILNGLRRDGHGAVRTAGTVSGLAGSLAGAGAARRNGGSGGADGIIHGVFGGRLGTAGRGGGALSYAHGGTSVPMHMSSSGIVDTAPIALAAEAMVPGDTLVVEEPEAHLHPHSQIRLAGQLAGMVRRGMRVVLSTHSPFLLEQLSILVQLEALTPAKRKARGYGRDAYVAASEVAPYAFGGSQVRGYTVAEIEHSADGGISQDEFVSVSESMSNDEYGIYLAKGGD